MPTGSVATTEGVPAANALPGAPAGGEAAPASPARDGRVASAATAGPASARPSATGTAGGRQSAGDSSPIVIGSVGDYSGAPGATLKAEADSLQVWGKWINAKGGILGHPVRVIVADDGSDPSRYRAEVQDLVENQHVVAFVANGAAQTADAGASYLEQKHVPVIGAGDGNKAWTTSPVYFNLQAPTDALMDGALKEAKAATNATKVAILSCVEAQACTDYYNDMPKYAPRNGMSIVYRTNISITQPDFTNECLQARTNGADLVVPVGDQNTFHRVYSDCARQGYHPAFIASAANDTDADVQGLDKIAAATGAFPFDGVAGNAPTQDYVNAFHTYAPSEPFGIYSALGWSSAKLFEQVATTVLEAGGPLTSSKLLDALGAVRNDTVGGLVLPLTYAPAKASQGTPFCWFPMLFTGGHWTGPNGMTPQCDSP